jgi:protein SCO1/2
MTRIYAILAAAAVATVLAVLGALALFAPAKDDKFAQCRGSTVGGGAIGGPFTLVSETGETVTDQDVFTKPTILYFGYTFCPDVCPLDTARNAEALDLLLDQGIDAQAAFISIDPERDTPEVVADFTDNLHPKMIGLTGTPEQVKAASQAYKTYYAKQQEGDPEYYLVDHSTFTYLVLPEIGFVDFFRRETPPQEIADRTACFVEAMK